MDWLKTKFMVFLATTFSLSNPSPPTSDFDYCYDEQAAVHTSLPPVQQDSLGLPQGWHQQIVQAISSERKSPDGLPAEITALPDLSGFRDVPNLHVRMAKDDTATLFNAVRHLKKQETEALFSPSSDAHEDIKNILFMWLGVQNVDPRGRGHFIDGRELAFIERLTGEPFMQMYYFPNPLPVAATASKDVFAKAFYHYYGMLVYAIAGPRLYDAKGILKPEAIAALRRQASEQKTPEAKSQFWQNVVAMASAAPDSPENTLTLDKAIRETSGLTFGQVETLINHGLKDDYDWEDHYARNANTVNWRHFNGRRIWFHGYYMPDFSKRRVCYSFIEG